MSNRPIGVPSRASPLDPKDRKEKRRKEKRREEKRTEQIVPAYPSRHRTAMPQLRRDGCVFIARSGGHQLGHRGPAPRGFTPTATGSTSRRLAMLAMGCCKQHFAKGFSDEPEFHPGKLP